MALDDVLLQSMLDNTRSTTELIGRIKQQNVTLEKLAAALTNGMAGQLETISAFVEEHGATMVRRAQREVDGKKPRSRWRDSIAMRITIVICGSGFGLTLIYNVGVAILKTVQQYAGGGVIP